MSRADFSCLCKNVSIKREGKKNYWIFFFLRMCIIQVCFKFFYCLISITYLLELQSSKLFDISISNILIVKIYLLNAYIGSYSG